MLLRLAAVLGGLAPAVLLFAAPNVHPAAGLGLAAAGVLVAARSGQRGVAVIGILVAAAAGLLAPTARQLLPLTGLGDELVTVDLRSEAFPDPPPQYANVRGRFRSEWMLDEYAVAPGARPKQSTSAAAVLVTFVGTNEDVVALRGAIVVARVTAKAARDANFTTIRGRVLPLPDELLGALAAIVRPAGGDQVTPKGVIIDTLDAPQPGEAWTRLVLVIALALAAVGCLMFAAGPRRAAASR